MSGTPSRAAAGAARAIAFAAGIVLLASAAPKLAHPADFSRVLHQYELLPAAALAPAAVFLPWLEAAAGAAILAVPRLRRGGAALGAGLLALFALATASVRLRGIRAACGCFSVRLDAAPAGWLHVAATAALALALAWAAVRLARRPAGRGRNVMRPPPGCGT